MAASLHYHCSDFEVNTPVIHISDRIAGMEDLATRLKRLRKEAGLTQAELAARAKVTQGTIGNIESGMRGYGKSLVDIARALKTTPEHLLGEPMAALDALLDFRPKTQATKSEESPMPGIDFAKVAALGRDERLQLEGAWLNAAKNLGFDVAAPRIGNRKAA